MILKGKSFCLKENGYFFELESPSLRIDIGSALPSILRNKLP
jgi:hypothetical protein